MVVAQKHRILQFLDVLLLDRWSCSLGLSALSLPEQCFMMKMSLSKHHLEVPLSCSICFQLPSESTSEESGKPSDVSSDRTKINR